MVHLEFRGCLEYTLRYSLSPIGQPAFGLGGSPECVALVQHYCITANNVLGCFPWSNSFGQESLRVNSGEPNNELG